MALRDSPGAAAPSVLYLCHAHAASSISSHTSPRRRQDMSRLPARAAATNDDNAAAPPPVHHHHHHHHHHSSSCNCGRAAHRDGAPCAFRQGEADRAGRKRTALARPDTRFPVHLRTPRRASAPSLHVGHQRSGPRGPLDPFPCSAPPTRSLESPSRPPVITHPGKRVIRNLRPENFSMPCFGWAQIARVELPRMACRAESQTASHQRRSQSPQCPARPPLVRHEPRLPRDCQSELNSARYKETQPCTAFVTKSAGS